MQPEKDGARDFRIDEVGDPGRAGIEGAQTEQHDRGRSGNKRDREDVHHDQAQQEQEQVDARRERERRRDVLAPGQLGRTGGDEQEREQAERERGWIENVRAAAFPLPLNQCLAEKPGRQHQELQVEPIVAKPEKEIRAQDDRKRAESEYVSWPPRPGQQHVECIGKEQLRHQQPRVVVHRSPEVAPIEDDRQLNRGLQIVLRTEHHLQGSSRGVAPPRDDEKRHPGEQHGSGGPEGADEHVIASYTGRERRREEGQCQAGGAPQQAHRRRRWCGCIWLGPGGPW